MLKNQTFVLFHVLFALQNHGYVVGFPPATPGYNRLPFVNTAPALQLGSPQARTYVSGLK